MTSSAPSALGVRALTFAKYGKAMNITEVTLPALGPKQLLVRVAAASVNPIDYKRRDGGLRLLMPEKQWPALLCFDASGIVESIGSDVTRFKTGDRVVVRSRDSGTMAEKCVVDEDVAVGVPEELDLVTIAGLPLAGQTALQMMEKAGIKEGSSVLISGGGGGVGSFAVQLAKQHFKCARVVATCGPSKADLVKSLGADEVIVYSSGKDEFAGSVGQFDALIDTVGVAAAMFKCGKKAAKCVSVAYLPTPHSLPFAGAFLNGVLYLLTFMTRRNAAYYGVSYDYHLLNPTAKDLGVLVDLMKEHKLRVVLDGEFKGLEAGQAAFEKLEGGRTAGKIVVAL